MTAPCQDSSQQPDIRASGLDVDVLIAGAGISGIGAGIELVRRRQPSFVLLESGNDVGGTWRAGRRRPPRLSRGVMRRTRVGLGSGPAYNCGLPMTFVPTPRLAAAVLLAMALCVPAATVSSSSSSPSAQDGVEPGPDPIYDAMHSMYNLDFGGAERVLNAYILADPLDPVGHATRAVAHLFAEFDRLQILELEFFESDDRMTDEAHLTPDLVVRSTIFASTAEARRLAGDRLTKASADRRALFAMGMAIGVENQYTTLIEHRYVRGGSLSKESQAMAERMLALEPPIYDAYLALGSIEYVVASLNPFYRLLARFRGLRGSKDRAIEHLQIVTAEGRYYGPYAKILLSVFYSREGKLTEARSLLEELRQSFPQNTLFPREVARIDERIARGGR